MPKYFIEIRNCFISECSEYLIKDNANCTAMNIDKYGNVYIEIVALNEKRAKHIANQHIDIHKSSRKV